MTEADRILADAYARLLTELGREFTRCLSGNPTIGRQGRPAAAASAAKPSDAEASRPASEGDDET